MKDVGRAGEEAFELVSTGFAIPCKLARPEGTPKGAVLLLPGSLFSDVDGNYPAMGVKPHVYADIAAHLAALGWASLRMAKIGPGTGARVISKDAADAHTAFAVRVTHAAEAMVRLRAAVPDGPLVVAGHSEGAVVASLLAAIAVGEPIDGVISLSGPALRLLDVLRGQVAGMGHGEMDVFDRAVVALRAGQPLAQEAAGHPTTAMLASMPIASQKYLADVDAVDPMAAVARVKKPMLLIQGERDDSVTAEQVGALAAARGSLPTELRRFPGLTHFYKMAPDTLSPRDAMGLTTMSDPRVARAMAEWAGKL